MCRDRHSTKSHAGDPKFYVAQTQAKHEHDPCQQPNEKWPTQTAPRELHPVEVGYPCYKVDKDVSTQCGQKCQCRDNLAKWCQMQVSSTSKFWALWKAAGEKQPPVATARASGPEAANFRTPSQSILQKTPVSKQSRSRSRRFDWQCLWRHQARQALRITCCRARASQGGMSHCPYRFSPTATAQPSLQRSTVWLAPVETIARIKAKLIWYGGDRSAAMHQKNLQIA